MEHISPLISIIIPVYNAEQYLHKMIDCLCRQSYKNYELLLIDDGSNDKSLEICRELGEKDKRIKVFSKENGGAYSARNFGLNKVCGEYVTFLDADDEIDDNYLEVLVDACKNADISICDVRLEHSGQEVARFSCDKENLEPLEAINLLLSRQQINSGPCAKMFKKTVICGLYFPALKVYEDIIFVLEAFKKSSCIRTTKNTTYHYIQNNGSTMGQVFKSPSCDIIAATEILMNYIKKVKDLSPKCCYITVSHLLQYAVPWAISCNFEDNDFLRITRNLYKKYLFEIITCKGMPWKEKIIFLLFIKSIIYYDGRFHKLKRG